MEKKSQDTKAKSSTAEKPAPFLEDDAQGWRVFKLDINGGELILTCAFKGDTVRVRNWRFPFLETKIPVMVAPAYRTKDDDHDPVVPIFYLVQEGFEIDGQDAAEVVNKLANQKFTEKKYAENLVREQLKEDWRRHKRKKGLFRFSMYCTAAAIAMGLGIAFQLTPFQTIIAGAVGAALVPMIFGR